MFCWACSASTAVGAPIGGVGSSPGYVANTGFHTGVNDAVPLGGPAFSTNFFGEKFDPLENIPVATDWRWMNWLFRMPGVANVTCIFHHWGRPGGGLTIALVYRPFTTELWIFALTPPAGLGAILAGPIVINMAGYRPLSWGVNVVTRETELIIWDNAPPIVIPRFVPAGGPYVLVELPTLAHNLGIFQPEYQRNLIATDELDDGTGRFVGAIDVRDYPMAGFPPIADAPGGSQNFAGRNAAGVPQPASFNWWDEVPVMGNTVTPWDDNFLGVGGGPSHSLFAAAAPPAGAEVAALVFYDHNYAAITNANSLRTSAGNLLRLSGQINRADLNVCPDQWNIRDIAGTPWDDPIFNSIEAGHEDFNLGMSHGQLYLEAVYGPIFAPVPPSVITEPPFRRHRGVVDDIDGVRRGQVLI